MPRRSPAARPARTARPRRSCRARARRRAPCPARKSTYGPTAAASNAPSRSGVTAAASAPRSVIGGSRSDARTPSATRLARLDERARAHGQPLALLRRQRLLHRLAQRRDVRVPGGVEEAVPAARRRRLDAGVECQPDREEAGRFRDRSRSRSSKSSIGSLSGGWIASYTAQSLAVISPSPRWIADEAAAPFLPRRSG